MGPVRERFEDFVHLFKERTKNKRQQVGLESY